MELDPIYPDKWKDMYDAPCVVAAVYFDEEELKGFGVSEDSLEVQEPFWDYNEFEKPFALWASPKFLSDYYDRYKSFLEQDYWKEITEDEFLEDVSKSIKGNKKELLEKMESNDFHSLVEPLDEDEEARRIIDSIKIKIKQGTIKGHYPFRFYAIEIEEEKCYLITGATIKVHKDMKKAPNTEIELKKLEKVFKVLDLNEVKTKDTFIEFFKKRMASNQ